MGGFNDWSSTANSNSSVGGVYWAEGQTAASVNNSARQMMADLADVREGNVPMKDTFTLCDPADTTKRVRFDGGNLSASTTRVVTVPNKSGTLAMLDDVTSSINSKSAETVPATGDLYPFHSASAGAERKITLGNLLKIVSSLSSVTVAPGDALLINDASDSYNSKRVSALGLAGSTPIARLSNVQADTVAGGSTTSTTWSKVPMTAEDYDADSIVSNSAGSFTLGAGTYLIEGQQVINAFNLTNTARLRLRNTSDGTTAGVGPACNSSDGGTDGSVCTLPLTKVTIAGSKTFEMQYYTQNGLATNGLGAPSSSGEDELYGYILIRRIAD